MELKSSPQRRVEVFKNQMPTEKGKRRVLTINKSISFQSSTFPKWETLITEAALRPESFRAIRTFPGAVGECKV